ncbi:MAG: TIGR00282 family metallophosphoesterase [candidate division Zixibacteria bacterium]|nr:TIGR00282 family metallophosphoesterase [candidate division Zixibacteria bacterium]
MPKIKIIFFADVVGKPGRFVLSQLCKSLKEKYAADYVIANIENAAGGFGITPEMSKKIFSYGVNCQTSGNHIWDRIDILKYLDEQPKLLRPANYPSGVPGVGYLIDDINGTKVAILNLMGRLFIKEIDCPFRVAERELRKIREVTETIIVDFHAEATSEKQALAHFLDGQVSAVIGTHTHVQTADETISERGTAYISDVGMTGPHDSIIGMDKTASTERFLTGMPKRFTCAAGGLKISGVVVTIDTDDGGADHIERFKIDYSGTVPEEADIKGT